jgi:hypothetical protein
VRSDHGIPTDPVGISDLDTTEAIYLHESIKGIQALFICLLLVHIPTLSLVQTVRRKMMTLLVEDKLKKTWKKEGQMIV